MSDANDITQIHRQSSFLVHDPSKPTGILFSVDYFQQDKRPYHLIRIDAAGRQDLGSFFTKETAQGRLQTALRGYDPGWVRPYTPPERPGAAASPSSAASPRNQPSQKPEHQSHHFDRSAREKPQREQDKLQQLPKPDAGSALDRPEQRSQRTEPGRASASHVFQDDEGGKISGKPMDLGEALKARREARGLGWSDVAKDYDAQFRQQWQKFRHQGDIRFWKEMGERTAVSAAGAVGGMAGGALAGAAVAGVGLSGITEAVVVGGVSGMAGSAASSGTEIGFGQRMSASAFGTRVVIGGVFGSVVGGIGASLFGPKPAPAFVSEVSEPVIARWRYPYQLEPNEFYGPYHHYMSHGASPKVIADSGSLMGGPMGTVGGLGLPSANATRGELPPGLLGVEFFTLTRGAPGTFVQTMPNMGARWTPGMPGVSTTYMYSDRLGREAEHAVVDIFVTKYQYVDPVTNTLTTRVGSYRPPAGAPRY